MRQEFCPQAGEGYGPLWADTPPPGRHPLQGRRPSHQTATAVDGTHPTGIHSSFMMYPILAQTGAKNQRKESVKHRKSNPEFDLTMFRNTPREVWSAGVNKTIMTVNTTTIRVNRTMMRQ